MRALHLDFLHPTGPAVRAGVTLIAVSVLAAAFVGWRYYVLSTEAARLETVLADASRLARRDLPRVRVTGGDTKVLAQEVGRANAVLASLTLPWDAMFGELESVANGNIALLGIQPESSGRQVRLSGEARRLDDLLAYVKRLEETPGFANVYIASHELKPGGVQRPVGFTLMADWVGRR